MDGSTELASELRLVLGRVVRKIRQAKHTVSDVPLSESSVLARLDRDGPDSPSSLATLEGVRPQAMAATLTALEQRDLITRTQDPTDGRKAIVTITAAGGKVVADRRSVSIRRLADAIADELTPAERDELQQTLRILDRLADRL